MRMAFSSGPPDPDAPPAAHLGWALRVRRQQMPCKREQVAEALGYSADVVKQIENGTYRASVEHYIAEWARVYGLDDELRELWERVREAREVERTYPNSRVEHSTRGSWRDLINSAAGARIRRPRVCRGNHGH
jgi:hypothetical protein